MPLKIKSVNHGTAKADKNRYCGPSVISAITGMTTGEAARLIRTISGVKSVKGTSTRQVRNALHTEGESIPSTPGRNAPLNGL